MGNGARRRVLQIFCEKSFFALYRKPQLTCTAMSAITTLVESQLSGLLNKDEICARFGISRRTVENLMNSNQFPPPVRLGKRVYWSEKALVAWQVKLFDVQEAWVRNHTPVSAKHNAKHQFC